ncbi:hypothetical protein [Teichococcus oryzae]|uniref:Uncharacterized protein n=1 Tax=Teichococcus oryzae TaxID=1608942 RepID=A0A5B2TIS2_9PROT|nr:hypothetical protein [Pseudoroseomonas oryzae]KAA2213690.1 hypothetical protein F0Q34_06360 [Pseudoroseomonas oryzae]
MKPIIPPALPLALLLALTLASTLAGCAAGVPAAPPDTRGGGAPPSFRTTTSADAIRQARQTLQTGCARAVPGTGGGAICR